MVRRAFIEVHPTVMAGMLMGHEMCEVKTNLPPDAVILDAYWDRERCIVRLIAESASFDDVIEGGLLPNFNVTAISRRSELQAVLDLVRPDS